MAHYFISALRTKKPQTPDAPAVLAVPLPTASSPQLSFHNGIINTQNRQEAVRKIARFNPEFTRLVHIYNSLKER
jgi:hypothetical protein